MTELEKRIYELVHYECEDGSCLMIHEKTKDTKLGALSLDHRSIGEEIVDELNNLSEMLYEEQLRTRPLIIKKHISEKDFEKIETLFKKYCGDLK